MKAEPERKAGARRVLVLTSSYPRTSGDAAGHFVEAEVRGLVRTGHHVTVLVPGPALAREPEEGVEVVATGGHGLFESPGALPRLLENPLRLTGLIAPTRHAWRNRKNPTEGYDRVVAHWLIPCAVPWALWHAAPGVPLEVVAHGSDLRLLLDLPPFVRHRIFRLLKRRNARLRFVSQQMKDSLLRGPLPMDLWCYVARAAVLPARVDVDVDLNQAQAREHLALDPSSRWAVLVGRLVRSKRPRVALRAASLVPELNVAVIGSGPLEEDLREEFPAARFLGAVPRQEALMWMVAADLLLAASRHEGAPTSIREARYLGTSVVTAAAGDVQIWSLGDPHLWVVD